MSKQTEQSSGAPAPAGLSPDALEFAPGLLAIQESPPARLPRAVAYCTCALFALLLAWSLAGQLDIVASAEGKLVPQTYVKIVQPADAGIVQDILVREGQLVTAGQVLMRMDRQVAKADETAIRSDLALKSLQLRRIDAELQAAPLLKKAGDPDNLFRQVQRQYLERREALNDALAQQKETFNKSRHEYEAAREVLAKLRQVTPILKQQSNAYADLGRQGYAGQLMVHDKQREYIEKEQDLKAQEATVASLEAATEQARLQQSQLMSKYRSDLQSERVEAEGQYLRLQQELAKQEHKSGLLELRAPQAGVVKEIATHTIGAVVSPGTVLLSVVPEHEPLVAEVLIKNQDVGFVYPQQHVKVKLAAYPFEQYGMLDGVVTRIGPDASDLGADQRQPQDSGAPQLQYKAVVALDSQQLVVQGRVLRLVPGMQVIAEINQGKRTVLEYLLSPLRKTAYDSGRER